VNTGATVSGNRSTSVPAQPEPDEPALQHGNDFIAPNREFFAFIGRRNAANLRFLAADLLAGA
jgi:hypothetical protein